MTQLDSRAWVAEQYRTPANLQARIQLHERFSTNPHRWPHWVFDHLQAPAGARLLEIGCGPGGLWAENRDRIPAGWHLLLTDLSPGMIQQAARALAGPANVLFGVADAQALPFADSTFDLVIANHMLYHVPDRARALAEIRRVLRPDGRFYAATNGKNHMAKVRELAQQFAPQAENQVEQHERFTFEQGNEEIGRVFGTVNLHRYENRLMVTDADALADYMLSGTPILAPEGAQELLRRWLHSEMDKTGSLTPSGLKAIEIVNETGLFEAVKTGADRPAAARRPAQRRTSRSRKEPPSGDE
ncbi:MAG: class I SAM-dependent methyltransferase [Caldilineaceae bacterium]|nr:class I SAM-dependent methyltransferase [Caldilineaceae bacterium]